MATRQQVNMVPRWPSVATAASLPNAAGSPTQSSYLEVGDECYVTGASALYVCTTATPGAAVWAAQGGGSSGPTVLWEWNGTDLTQFDAPEGDAGFTWSVTTWNTRYPEFASLTDVPAIRCDSPNVAPRVNGLLIKPSELPALPTRFAIVARMTAVSPNAVPQLIAYWENNTHYVGAYRQGANTIAAVRNNAAWVDTGVNLLSQADTATSGDYVILRASIVPATPAAKPYAFLAREPSPRTDWVFVDQAPLWYEPLARASYDVSWQGLAHNPRVGLAMRAWNSVAVSPGFLWADIKVVALP